MRLILEIAKIQQSDYLKINSPYMLVTPSRYNNQTNQTRCQKIQI